MTSTYIREQLIDRDLHEVFEFFADASNLEAITPPWLNFQTITPMPVVMEQGVTMEHRLRLHRIPLSWVTEITDWMPPFQFADSQKSGPFADWIHTHHFTTMPSGTLMTDTVVYRVPGRWAGRVIDRLYVERDVNRIFDFRQGAITRLISATRYGY
jgi:hypothetical protein